MKFKNRFLSALAFLLPLTIVLGILYIGSYFLLMEQGAALNRQTLIPEYSSVQRFRKSHDTGPISLQISYSSWLNPIYQPLDKIFRKKQSPPIKWKGFE